MGARRDVRTTCATQKFRLAPRGMSSSGQSIENRSTRSMSAGRSAQVRIPLVRFAALVECSIGRYVFPGHGGDGGQKRRSRSSAGPYNMGTRRHQPKGCVRRGRRCVATAATRPTVTVTATSTGLVPTGAAGITETELFGPARSGVVGPEYVASVAYRPARQPCCPHERFVEAPLRPGRVRAGTGRVP